MRYCLALLKITLHTRCVCRRPFIFSMPAIGRFCQMGTILAHCPRRTLTEADRQRNVERRIIRFVQLSYIVVGYSIGNLPLGHLLYQILYRKTVALYLVNKNTASQLIIKVLQPIVITPRLHINLFPHQFGHILQRLHPSLISLHNDLMRDDLLATIKQTILPLIGYRQMIGYQVALACTQHPNQFIHISGHLHPKMQPQTLGKLLGQFILKSHLLPPIIKI
ncbi:hypothetical protein EVA_21193 [gut metagenome]|uniref:Uncharacterized protein n=1 Tax=gut metagenome TaxID=749906 RepID=J9BT29_9ZZZZ